MTRFFGRNLGAAALAAGAILATSGCGTVRNADTTAKGELAEESNIVVVRPDRYTLLGTRSVSDYLEVSYERFTKNAAGLPQAEVGVRSRGGEHWWDLKGPSFTIYAQAVFYGEPVAGVDARSKPLYKTNKRAVPLQRGATADLSFTCPVKGAKGYQVIFSEN
jgi:hypothetical protein